MRGSFLATVHGPREGQKEQGALGKVRPSDVVHRLIPDFNAKPQRREGAKGDENERQSQDDREKSRLRGQMPLTIPLCVSAPSRLCVEFRWSAHEPPSQTCHGVESRLAGSTQNASLGFNSTFGSGGNFDSSKGGSCGSGAPSSWRCLRALVRP